MCSVYVLKSVQYHIHRHFLRHGTVPMELLFDVPYVTLSGAHFGTGLVPVQTWVGTLIVIFVVQKN